MYRTLENVIKITEANAFIYSDLKKIYKYTSAYFPVVSEEYIYIPMTDDKEDIFDLIENHMKNPNCKGFFIERKLLRDMRYIKIINKYSPENVLVVELLHLAGYLLAQNIAQKANPQIIILAGTDETEELRNTLCLNLGIENYEYENNWQKETDPLLRFDEKNKYVLIETNLDKNIASIISKYHENSIVIYTKSSPKQLNLYRTAQKYNEEWVKLVLTNPQAVFIENDNKFPVLPDLKNKLHTTNNLAESVLKYLGIKEIKYPKEKKSNVYIDKSQSLYNIKQSIKKFINNNKKKKKIIIFEEIPNLAKIEFFVHDDIMQEITEEIDSLVVISNKVLTSELSLNNKKTIIKRVDDTSESSLIEIKKFINWRVKDNNTIFLIISGDKNVCSLV